MKYIYKNMQINQKYNKINYSNKSLQLNLYAYKKLELNKIKNKINLLNYLL